MLLRLQAWKPARFPYRPTMNTPKENYLTDSLSNTYPCCVGVIRMGVVLWVFFVVLHALPVSAQSLVARELVQPAKVGVFYKFYRRVFPTEEQKAIREALKTGKKPRLSQEGAGLLEVPAALKTVIGEFYLDCNTRESKPYSCPCEGIDNPEKAYIELKGTQLLVSQYALKKEDALLLIEIGDFIAKHTQNTQYAGRAGFQRWLNEQCTRLEGCFGQEVSKVGIAIDSLQTVLSEIVAQITSLKGQQEALQQQLQQLNERLTAMTNEKQVAEMRLTATLQNYEQVVRQLDALVPSSDPVWSSAPIDGTNAGVRLVRNNTATEAVFSPELTSYRLGTHCDGEIARAAQAIVEALLRQNYATLRNPQAAREVRIKLRIRGKADATQIRNCLTYYGEPISATYYPVVNGNIARSQPRQLTLRSGMCEVNNEGLAFLRAYCAYRQVIEVLERENLTAFFPRRAGELGDVEFYAEEHTAQGEPYRGVDISIEIEGLYQHKQRERVELLTQKTRVEAEEKQIGEQLAGAERERKRIEVEIQKLENRRRYYERLLIPQMIQRDVDRILKNIEEYESFSPDTRRVVREGLVPISEAYRYILLAEKDKKAVRKGEKTIYDF